VPASVNVKVSQLTFSTQAAGSGTAPPSDVPFHETGLLAAELKEPVAGLAAKTDKRPLTVKRNANNALDKTIFVSFVELLLWFVFELI
jgi:hypothetical protein